VERTHRSALLTNTLYGWRCEMPLVIASVLVVLFTGLLITGRIGEVSYSFLVSVTALLGLVLHGFGRLQELDLRNLKLTLRELKQTRDEIFVREERLKAILIPLAQIIAFSGAVEGRWTEAEFLTLKREWYKKKLRLLIESLGFDSAESKEAQKYIGKYDEIDRLFAGRSGLNITDPDYKEVKQEIEALSNQVNAMLKADLAQP